MGLVEAVFVVLGLQIAEGQGHRHHVLQAMVAVGGIGQHALLGNDADGRFLGGDDDAIDLGDAVAHQRMQAHRRLAGRLAVELGREADLEQDVLHHIAAECLG
ncbi:hypothetical protein D9M71_83480 [compost metagenome]